MARVTIQFDDDEESGKVTVRQHWEPSPVEGVPLTEAQVRGFQALGLDIDLPEVWETMDGPGGPI